MPAEDKQTYRTYRKNGTTPGKRPSFAGAELRSLRVELPVNLVNNFHFFVVKKKSRLNTELAEAVKLYLETNRETNRRRGKPR